MMFYLLELMATLPEVPVEHDNITAIVWGVGLRVGIAATKFDGNLKASIAGVAAEATVNSNSTFYSTTSIGLGSDVLSKGGQFFSAPSGPFDAGRMDDLGEGLNSLSTYLIGQAREREPSPIYAVGLQPQGNLALSEAVSSRWALTRLLEGSSCNGTLKMIDNNNPLQAKIDEHRVRSIYQEIINNAEDDFPSYDQQLRAQSILSVSEVS